jgi:radical SAM superfamily enzyme YgiQ (UPF0313 family)
LGVLYVAAYLRERIPTITLSIIDGTLLGYRRTLEGIRSFQPDVLGISYTTLEVSGAHRLVQDVKRELPETFVVVGGPHVSALPSQSLSMSRADVAVIGEGEITMFELVELLARTSAPDSQDLSRIDGIAFRKVGGKIALTMPRKFADIDSFPFPARDMIDLAKYQNWTYYRRRPQTNIVISRGCPFNCEFCANAVWRSSSPRYRIRSPQNVADEIEVLTNDYGISEYFDNSDEFNTDVDKSIAICDEIARRKLDISWKTCVRAYPLPDELVEAMARSGCWFVYLGIESGNPETLEGIGKKITLDQVIRACETLQKYGIKVFGLFMLFNVWEEGGLLRFEDAEKSMNTLRFAQELFGRRLLSYISWSPTVPYPGSRLFETVQRHRAIREDLLRDWDAWSWAMWTSDVLRLPGVTSKEQMKVRLKGAEISMRHTFRETGQVSHPIRYYLSAAFRSLTCALRKE